MLLTRLTVLGGLFIFIHLHQCVSSYRVLAVITTISYSHFKSMERILHALTERGHQVTVLSNHPEKLKSPNYVAVDGKRCSIEGLPDTVVDEQLTGFVPIFLNDLAHFYDNLGVSECYLKSDSFQQVFKSNQTFDLVMVEYFNHRLFTELGYIFGAPVIHFSSLIPPPWVAVDYGYPINPSYISSFVGSCAGNRISFLDRVRNTVEVSIALLLDEILLYKKTQELVNRYADTKIPPMRELMKNSSLLLVNTHYTISGVRPVVPNVVEIGGIHIEEAKELPEVIRVQFLKLFIDLKIFKECLKWYKICFKSCKNCSKSEKNR